MKKKLDSIFSRRQELNNDRFEIFYYNDMRIAPVGEHMHDHYEFYFFLEGDACLQIGNQIYKMFPHSFYIVPPHTLHHLNLSPSEKPYRRFVLWIAKEYLEQFLEQSSDYAFLIHYVQQKEEYAFDQDTVTFHQIQNILFELIEETRGNRYGKETCQQNLIASLLFFLNRLIYEMMHHKTTYDTRDLYQLICAYIDEHLSDDLTLDTLAAQFFVSKFYISHLFKDRTSMSLHQFITKKRLFSCKNEIANGGIITKIMRQYGFYDYSAFYRAFKKEYGISPKEYALHFKESLHP